MNAEQSDISDPDMALPYKLYLITLECEYMHKKNERDIVEKVRVYFRDQEQEISSKVKAKTFFKLGSWVYERTESFTKENLE